jgi:hypothetical protein
MVPKNIKYGLLIAYICYSHFISFCLQVKGLSAMTKEALGLTSTAPKTTTINGNVSD